jgi:hypothetical protein
MVIGSVGSCTSGIVFQFNIRYDSSFMLFVNVSGPRTPVIVSYWFGGLVHGWWQFHSVIRTGFQSSTYLLFPIDTGFPAGGLLFLLACFCWTYFFDPEDGGDIFFRNVCWNSSGELRLLFYNFDDTSDNLTAACGFWPLNIFLSRLLSCLILS